MNLIRAITIIASAAGLGLAVWAATTAIEVPPVLIPEREPSVNPFGSGVAALGKVEPRTREQPIGAPQPGLVTEVLVDVGDAVKKGQPLFQLDARPLRADLVRAQADLEIDRAAIQRWHAQPRAEDIPPLEADVERARAALADQLEQLDLIREAQKKGAATSRDVTARQFEVDRARAGLARAQADLDRMKAGGWKADLAVAEADLARSTAEVEALNLLLDRLTVRAPRDGVVLRRQIEPGEYAASDPARPALIIGDLSDLNIRAQVDEEDIGLITPHARAVARLRGAVVEEFPLMLVRVEPYARPKVDITGMNVERIDTRVIDVLFHVEQEPKTPIYPGQAVDVFIETAPKR
ncbi:MAG: efflux RND transporter periplasmic adaptor subunit [Phycisphaerales bacterium]|nr:efflux RND transporter periplasmic adaptor subunit [Phycisphaerales bacterium]